MKTNVTCPICKNSFNLEDSFLADFRDSIKSDLQSELQQREFELNERLERSRQEIRDSAMKASYMKLKDKDRLISDLKDQIFKISQKIESSSSSQQAAGETQELLLEELLRNTFANTDTIEEVPKGKAGADCKLIIRTKNSIELGSILYESKRVQNFNETWLSKLKIDQQKAGASLAILVSSVMPKDTPPNAKFICKEGIWVCLFEQDVIRTLSILLRYSIIKVFEATQQNKFDATEAEKLFSFLHSQGFVNLYSNVHKAIMNMDAIFAEEKTRHLRVMKMKEQYLQDMLNNTLELYHSMKVISPSIPEMLEYKKAS